MEDNKLIKNALLKFLEKYSEKKGDIPYIIDGENSYTILDVYSQIEQETELGLSLADKITLLTVDLLTRNKEKL